LPTGVGVKVGGFTVEVGVRVGVEVKVGVKLKVGLKVAVELGVRVAVGVEVREFVGVGVAAVTVTVAPATGRPLNNTVCPLVPLAPVKLKA